MILGFILLSLSITLFFLSLKVLLLNPKKYALNHAKVKALKSGTIGRVDRQNVKQCLNIDTRNGEIVTSQKAIVDTY